MYESFVGNAFHSLHRQILLHVESNPPDDRLCLFNGQPSMHNLNGTAFLPATTGDIP